MPNISRRNLLRVGAGAACQVAAAGLPQQSPSEMNTTEAWHVEAEFSRDLREPNFSTADSWWPEQRNVWTPIGWKDHYFRFNVVYNGTVICEPCPDFAPVRPHATRWQGQSFQLNFVPLAEKAPPPIKEVTQLWRTDGGVGLQGWDEKHSTPILWTEWRLQNGTVVRQEIFSHLPSGKAVETGIEPHFAWIRLSVVHVDPIESAKFTKFSVQLSKVYYKHVERYQWEDGITIDVEPEQAPYAKELHAEHINDYDFFTLRLREPDQKIRLIAWSKKKGSIEFSPVELVNNVYNLALQLDADTTSYVDILLPFLAAEESEIDAEYALGRERALAESDAFWSQMPSGAAKVHVPEGYINRIVKQGVKLAETIAEKDYVNGDYTFLTGSWGYDNLWSTPTSMTSHMFLDLLGYNDSVERHLELFRKHQGSVRPPGPSYKLHPGYFSTPQSLTAFNWITDHGAILHQVSSHALFSNDGRFLARWTDAIVKGCDFIKDACATPTSDSVNGLLPPAVASDDLIPTQAIYSLAWNYKGLTTAVQLLKRMGHLRAEEFEELAISYKTIFVKAFRELAASAPTWEDASGNKRPKVPTTLSTKPLPQHAFSAAFYLDTGPMILVWAGLMDADDDLMRASVDYFREGPDVRLYGYRPNPLNRPVLIHEISSCEPCYSWNVFHSWQLCDKQPFLEGLYSLLAGSMSKQTFSACEHRHGIQSTQSSLYLAFYCLRLAVIDDQLCNGELHLLRLCPKAWISLSETTSFERMPTAYGLVTLSFQLLPDGKTLDVRFLADWFGPAPTVIMHTSSMSGISTIAVNGVRHTKNKIILLKASRLSPAIAKET